MSEIAALTNSGNDSAVPGYILSRPRIEEIGMAEVYFADRYLSIVNRGTASLSPKLAEVVVLDAKNDILTGRFGWGGTIFDIWAMNRSSLPYLTWLCVRVKHEQVKLEQVMGWYAGNPIDDKGTIADADKLASATWEAWDYAKKNVGGNGESQSPPTGNASTTDVAPQPPPAQDSPPSSSST